MYKEEIMDKQFFRNISNMIEEAIQGYEELLEFYKEKKQALLTQDKDMLAFVDEKIVAQAKYLTNINKKREEYCKENDVAPVRITELIELAQKEVDRIISSISSINGKEFSLENVCLELFAGGDKPKNNSSYYK